MKIISDYFNFGQLFASTATKSELPQKDVLLADPQQPVHHDHREQPVHHDHHEQPVHHDHRAWAAEYTLALEHFKQGGRRTIQQMNGPLFRQTQDAIEQGFLLPDGQRCEVDRNVYQTMLQKTRFVDVFAAPLADVSRYPTAIQVKSQSTFQATQALVKEGFRPLVLDMANRKSIGGAPDRANAQEEMLCRQSALYPALASMPNDRNNHYSTDISYRFLSGGGILVPGVQFFRTDPSEGYAFCPPFTADVFASAAYNCNQDQDYDRPRKDLEYIEGTKERIRTMLRAAVENGNDSVVLSAFGCGAFQNDPRIMATLYREVLDEEFKGAFRRVVFGIIDSQGSQNCAIFQEVFGAF